MRAEHAESLRVDSFGSGAVHGQPSDQRRTDVAIVRPFGCIFRIVRWIGRINARAAYRKFSAIDVVDVSVLEERALGAREVGKPRQSELDERGVAIVGETIGAAR
jgi:hypothetical protein